MTIGKSGKFIPPGMFLETGQPGKPPARPGRAPLDILKRLPGAIEWGFECFQDSTAVAAGNAIGNTSPGVPTNFQVEDGFEGIIDWLVVGPNMIPSTVAPTWNASLTVNRVAVPGYEFFGRLMMTDGVAGNWWAFATILVGQSTLIELRKASDTFGASPTTIGGRVHGFTWPLRSRIDWEQMHPET
jgi:hypothetical protein